MMDGIRYADALRVIGRLMDAEKARLFEIDEEDEFLSISWQDRAGDWHSRSYHKTNDLSRLFAEAARTRGHASPSSGRDREPLLRTLGQDLDRAGVRLSRIRETRGFEVRGLSDGQLVDYCYSVDELDTKNRERQTPRTRPNVRSRRPWWRTVSLRRRTAPATETSSTPT
jgi:hypothetical protein